MPLDNVPLSHTHCLEFEHRTGYLYVFVQCDSVDLAVYTSIWMQTAYWASQTLHKKILLELDIPRPLSIADLFWLGTRLPSLGLRGHRIAIADPYIEKRETNQFADLVSNNRGVNTRTFSTIEMAKLWLIGPVET